LIYTGHRNLEIPLFEEISITKFGRISNANRNAHLESLYSVKVGGVAPHVSELSEALAKGYHEVHVFTRRGDFDAYDRINGVHYQRVDFDQSGSLIEEMDSMSAA